MKKFLSALSVMVAVSSAAMAEEVTIAVDSKYPPYTFKKGGEAKGAYVDIMKEADKLMPSFELTFKAMSWKKGLEAMQSGEYVALIPPYKNKDRDYMTYGEPFSMETVAVLCNKKNIAEKPKNYPADYKGLTFANNTGFASPGEAFFKEVKAGNIKVVEAKSTQVNLLKLASREVDCYANDSLVMAQAMAKLAKGNATRQREFEDIDTFATVSENAVYVGVSVKNDHPSKAKFREEMNAAIKQLQASGKVDEILANYK